MELTHFENLLRLITLEREAEKTRREEEKARLTLLEQEERGLSASNLESVDESFGLGGRTLVTFARPDKAAFLSPFHNGDLVEVRPRKRPDEKPAWALVSKARRDSLQLAFDRPPPAWIHLERIRLDVVPNDVTFDRMRSALQRVMALEKAEDRRRRDVLLGTLAPRFFRPVPFSPSAPLNPEQQIAATQALAAEDVYLVHGPPGTGKSHVLAEVAVQHVKAGKRVLATAASNAAVDHLLELCLDRGLRAIRVGHPARVSPALVEHTLDVRVENHPDFELSVDLRDEAWELQGHARRQRKQGRSRDRFAQARAAGTEAKTLLEEARALEKKAVRSVMDQADVVCATLASLDGPVLANESFDVAVVDEATQATEPLTLMAFLKARRLVLAGDHKQLPPTLLSLEAAKQGLGKSLFERLLELYGEDVKTLLLEQYRMNDAIAEFPSKEMYEGLLRSGPGVGSRVLGLPPSESAPDVGPVLFIDTAGKGFDEEQEEGSGSYRNPGEATLLTARFQMLSRLGIPPAEIALIAPYSAQVALLRETLAAAETLEIDTVDAFQGREKDAVLISLVRSNTEGSVGFLKDVRRMNVALTRARKHLFVVGDSATLSSEPFYVRLMDHIQKSGGYRSAWEWPEES